MSKARDILTLSICGAELRFAVLRRDGERIAFGASATFRAPDAEDETQAIGHQETLDRARAWIAEHRARCCPLHIVLGGAAAAAQYYDLPPLKGPALKQAATLKLSHELHFDASEAIVDVRPLPFATRDVEGGQRVCVAAARRDLVDAVFAAARFLNLTVASVTSAPTALMAMAQSAFASETGLVAAVFFDEKISTFLLLSEGYPLAANELPIGLGDLTAGLMRPIISGDDVIQLEADRALALRNHVGIPDFEDDVEPLGIKGEKILPLIEPTLQTYAKHLTQWVSFAATTGAKDRVQTLHVVGPGAHIRGLSEALASRLTIDVMPMHWMASVARFEGDEAPAFAPAVGAALDSNTLPALIPLEEQKRRQIARFRQSVVMWSPIVAATVLLFALFFGRVNDTVEQCSVGQVARLSEMQQLLDRSAEVRAEQRRVDELSRVLNAFSEQTPDWVGLFKELSLLLPEALQVTAFDARPAGRRMELKVEANVYTGSSSTDFDQTVEQTLVLLQRSPFFEHVELITVNRMGRDDDPRRSGTFAVRLVLSYPLPPKDA